jgi:hypothetical protein
MFKHPVTHTCTLTGRQRSKRLRAQCHASAISLARSNSLAVGTAELFSNNTHNRRSGGLLSESLDLPSQEVDQSSTLGVRCPSQPTGMSFRVPQTCRFGEKRRLQMDSTEEAGRCCPDHVKEISSLGLFTEVLHSTGKSDI